jgi:hypothetical protein
MGRKKECMEIALLECHLDGKLSSLISLCLTVFKISIESQVLYRSGVFTSLELS